MNFVTEAPTLPAPKIPMARPLRLRENQEDTQVVPTEKELPARPTANARASSIEYDEASETRKLNTAEATSSTVMTILPPMRSAMMPAGRRHSEPLRIATDEMSESSTSVSSNSCWMEMPSTPNMSQAANIRVNAIVAIVRTR